MKPADFDYFAPTTRGACLDLLGELADCRVLAGGQSLLPRMSLRLERPRAVVDLRTVPGLADRYVGREGALAIGCMTRQADLLADAGIAGRHPLLASALSFVGTVATRNRGTLGGSLAFADPCAELPAAAAALGAVVVLDHHGGRRRVAVEDFVTGPFRTSIGRGELLTSIELPSPSGRPFGCWDELATLQLERPYVGVGVTGWTDESGRVGGARVVTNGWLDRPFLLERAADALVGRTLDAVHVDVLGAAIRRDLAGERPATNLPRANVLVERLTRRIVAGLARDREVAHV
ncbi:MAG: hypothetical protein ABS81_04125 [Pseudonocardia sp. SCN 72-86]|nr:MAG: hypothetical protein ABS81_04125 [Pseudonocardia sp. SCN 72-86]